MKKRMRILALVLILTGVVAGGVFASGGAERPREALGSGASTSASGVVVVRATLGQPAVGLVTNTSGQVSLGQGFWHGGTVPTGGYSIHLPLVIR